MTITDRATGITEHIRATLPTLSPAERRVATELLRDPQAVIHQSVTELALRAETSAATVVRLCTSVGLRGFQDLKITLARETIPTDQRVLGAILPDDDDRDIVRKVLGGSIAALEQAVSSVDTGAVTRIADTILGARRVHFGAVGTSAPLASDAAYRLTTIGIDATFHPDVHAQHVGARMLGPEDVFFAISHTGSTFETLATAKAARAAGATIVALTSFASSPLLDVVDHAVIAGSPEVAYRVEAMASRIVHLALFDAIFVLLTLRSPDSADYQNLTADVLIEHRI
ncbi:transcriptional regulator, RpiR family [Rathayibacter oskolensis]|uniref:Transcriptional regulator, RpiR family n=1 Tax=Rathayibacter oskolensis TaxID=1891671 RepID=A0A1X7MU80_9MICO|nr:MurR/RpiR family transcriptional regulator [Rathayibacter oskolensis]SMH28195.1 transcriptional regulator, RpiR family [Rathayibacter oskolensis]